MFPTVSATVSVLLDQNAFFSFFATQIMRFGAGYNANFQRIIRNNILGAFPNSRGNSHVTVYTNPLFSYASLDNSGQFLKLCSEILVWLFLFLYRTQFVRCMFDLRTSEAMNMCARVWVFYRIFWLIYGKYCQQQ